MTVPGAPTARAWRRRSRPAWRCRPRTRSSATAGARRRRRSAGGAGRRLGHVVAEHRTGVQRVGAPRFRRAARWRTSKAYLGALGVDRDGHERVLVRAGNPGPELGTPLAETHHLRCSAVGTLAAQVHVRAGD